MPLIADNVPVRLECVLNAVQSVKMVSMVCPSKTISAVWDVSVTSVEQLVVHLAPLVTRTTVNVSAKIMSLDESVMKLNRATVCPACSSINLRQKTLTWRMASVFDMDLTNTSSMITLSADMLNYPIFR